MGVATLTMICAVGPRFPPTSRRRTVMRCSPGPKAAVVETILQNCVVDSGLRVRPSFVKPECVHGLAALKASKRQAKSLRASVINGSESKLGGSMPGMPPPPVAAGPVSQTVRLPLPIGRVFWICRSGRLDGGTGCSDCPGNRPLRPKVPSTTMRNWPESVLKTRRP